MREYFEIKPAPVLLQLVIVAHATVALIIFFYLEPLSLKLPLLALLLLLAVLESKQLFQQEIINLALDSSRAEIALEQAGQPYFYSKYKVYRTRWFAILKLVNPQHSRTLILTQSAFKSDQSYRRLRYCLQQMERHRAA